MKKLLLILVAATMTLAGYAAGKGDGSSKTDAIEFDWVNGNTQEANTTLWYRVPLKERLNEVDNPNIALNLTNLTSSSAKVDISAIIAGDEESRTYTIGGNSSKTWNSSASMLIKMDYSEMFVKLTTTQKIHLSAKVFEGTFADDACLKAVAYDEGQHSISKGTHWYSLDVNKLRAAKRGLRITYKAESGTSKIISMISTDCPSTGLAGLKGSIPNGKTKVHEISPVFIQNMPELISTIYLKVENSKDLLVTTEPLYLPENYIDFSNFTAYDIEASNPVVIGATAGVYRVALADLTPKGKGNNSLEPQITFNNEKGNAEVNVTMEIAFDSIDRNDFKTKMVITKNEIVAAGESYKVDFARNILESLNADSCKYVYIRFTADNNVAAFARLKRSHESDACLTAQVIDWKETIYLDVQTDDEAATAWYGIKINEIKQNHQNLTIKVTNRGTETAEVTGEVVFECPSVAESMTRKIEAGKTVEKEIKYSSIATIGSDMVYVGVTSTQSLKVEVVPTNAQEKNPADNACENAVAFNWEEGHKQAKGEVVWYSVSTEDFKTIDFIPELIINNEGAGQLIINGELSFECPDKYENQVRSLTIAANGTYKKELSSEMVKQISTAKAAKDENGNDLYTDKNVYIKISGNQDFNFRVNKKIENEGANCSKAIPFNWTSGHNQEANETLWYVIDLTNIKDDEKSQGKMVHLTIKSLTGKDATIEGLLATECPTTSPQSQTITVNGSVPREKNIARTTFKTFGDQVYVRLKGSQKFHFEASLVASTFETLNCDDHTFEDVDVIGKDYFGNSGEKWFRVKTEILKDEKLAPQITVTNKGKAQGIKAAVAFKCGDELSSTSRSFAAGQVLSKMIERSMVDQITKNEYVYVRVNAGDDYTFKITLENPNTGADCMHAIEIEDGVTYPHAAGTTLWYKLNAKELRDPKNKEYKYKFSLTNTDGKAGVVNATAYTDCEGIELVSGSATVGANATREKTVMPDVFKGVNSDWIYLKLTAAQAQNLKMTREGRKKLDPAIEECGNAKYFAVNTDYNQKAGESVWYRVNIKELRENTIGDATLIVTNLTGEDATMKAELAWECPVEYEMTEKSRVLKGNEVYNRGFSRELLNSAEGSDSVYIRVTSDKQMKFRVNMHLSKGDDCSNPVMFDWKYGNINPQGECMIYRVNLYEDDGVTLRIPEEHDLQLNIQNIGEQKTSVSLGVGECGANGMDQKTRQYTLTTTEEDEAKSIITKTVAREKIIENLSLATMAMQLCSPNSAVRVWAVIVPNVGRDTVTIDTVFYSCDNVEFDYFVENQKDGIDTVTTTISFAEKDTIQWSDLRQVNDGFLMTSYKNYTFTAIKKQNVALIDHAIVPDSLMFKVGDVIKDKYEKLDDYLTHYYDSVMNADSLAGFTTLEWYVANEEGLDSIHLSPIANTPLTADLDSVVMVYHVVTECRDTLVDSFTMRLKTETPCDPVFDMTTLDIDWGKAYCGLPYDTKAVKKQIQDAFDAAGVKDDMKLYFDLGNGFKEIDNTVMTKDANVKFYAEAISTCDATQKAVSATKTVTVEKPDAKGDQVTNLPLVSELDNWVLVIDLKSINDTYDLNLVQGDETEKKVEWYKDGEKIKEGGYYYADNKQLDGGNYYAIITIAEGEDNCGGSWRTEVRNIQKAASVGVRKQMINGKLYIITEDNVMYDAQGQKVQ